MNHNLDKWSELLVMEQNEPRLFVCRQKEIYKHFYWSCLKLGVKTLVQMQVTIKTPGNLETVVTLDNFMHKVQFYLDTYDETFEHKKIPKLRITGYELAFREGENVIYICDVDVNWRLRYAQEEKDV